jgi:hypothetical protein
VYPDADCQGRQKRFLAQGYIAIIAFLVILITSLCIVFPAHATAVNYSCYALVNNGNRISSVFTGSYTPGVISGVNRPATLPIVRELCHDTGTGSYRISHIFTQTEKIIATRVVTVPDGDGHADYVQSWGMSSVANQLGCAAASGNQANFPGLNQAIALLPQSPLNMRIPTLITKMAGENSLAGNLAIELYSGVWQFLGILTSFKLFKVFFRG